MVEGVREDQRGGQGVEAGGPGPGRSESEPYTQIIRIQKFQRKHALRPEPRWSPIPRRMGDGTALPRLYGSLEQGSEDQRNAMDGEEGRLKGKSRRAEGAWGAAWPRARRASSFVGTASPAGVHTARARDGPGDEPSVSSLYFIWSFTFDEIRILVWLTLLSPI